MKVSDNHQLQIELIEYPKELKNTCYISRPTPFRIKAVASMIFERL